MATVTIATTLVHQKKNYINGVFEDTYMSIEDKYMSIEDTYVCVEDTYVCVEDTYVCVEDINPPSPPPDPAQPSTQCPPGTTPVSVSVCGCPCVCCCPIVGCCKTLRLTYKCGKNLAKCPKIPCAGALLNKNNKINTDSYVEKVGKYGQIINNKINYNEIWNSSEKSINDFPEFSFEPIYSKDGKFSFGEPEWDEDGNLYAGVNMAAGSVPCPTDCAILTIILNSEGGCLSCPTEGRLKVSCDSFLTAEIGSNPSNKRVSININNSGETALVKKGSFIKIEVSIGENDQKDQIILSDAFNVGPYPNDCPCSLACCECISTINFTPDKTLIKNKIIYRTKNIESNNRKAFFNKSTLEKIASERLKKLKNT